MDCHHTLISPCRYEAFSVDVVAMSHKILVAWSKGDDRSEVSIPGINVVDLPYRISMPSCSAPI